MNLSSSAPTGDIATALAVRYRPRSFSSLTGQKHVSTVLRRAIADRNVPQQLLFSGGSGLGKTTVARILAAALLCQTPLSSRDASDACGTCESCLDVLTPGRHHPDLVEFDAASNGGKDEIREIAQRAQLSPMIGPVKIYIVDEAHGLSGPGGQAFLKLLEEPPSHVVFMLCTTDPQKMLKTNRGRCVEFELLPPSKNELIANLQRIASAEGWVASNDLLGSVVDSTDPDLGLRGTIMTLAKLTGPLTDGVSLDDDTMADLLGTAPRRLIADVVSAIDAADPLQALDAINAVRTRASDKVVRSALSQALRDRMIEELRAGSQALLAIARYEKLVAAPIGSEWTDLIVVQLARPALEPAIASSSVISEEATRLQDELTRTIAEARSIGFKLVEATRQARSASTGASQAPTRSSRPEKPAAGPAAPAARLTGPSRTAKPSRPAVAEQTVELSPLSDVSTPRLSPQAAQLIAAASPAPPTLSALLARCDVKISDAGVVISAPVEVRPQLEALEKLLRNASGRLGLALVVEYP